MKKYPPDEEGRVINLKTGVHEALEINRALEDLEAAEAIQFYLRFKRMGMPFGPWGQNPHKLVQVVDVLEPLDELYHPKVTL